MEYRDSHRELQDRFDTRRLADRLASVAGDDGNGMFLSVGNVTENAKVGLLFIDFSHGPRQRSVFVPVAGERPPVPDWKRDEWFDGTLPADDPALDTANPSAPSIPRF